jgi:CubicO group peptidase (beta-lactamase class C family)
LVASRCLCAGVLGLLASLQDQDEPAQRLAAVAERSSEELGASGLVVALSLDGEVVYAEGWGYADPARKRPAQEGGVLPGAALTPALLTLGVLQLVEEGALELEDPLSKHFGELELGEQGSATVEQLLRHTSGLPPLEDDALDDPVAWLAGEPLRHEPGTCASYSGANTYWLGRLLEARSGQSVAEFVEERLAAPLALEATGHAGALSGRPRGEGRVELSGGLAEEPSAARWFAAADLRTSALDLLALVHAVGSGGLVSEGSLRMLQEPAALPDGTEVTFVGGFSRTALGELDGWTIGGFAAGGGLHAAWYPEVELAVAVLSTDEGAPLALVERRLVRAFLGQVGPELPALELPQGAAERYVGGYFVGCLSYRVEERGGSLWLLASDGRDFRLDYLGGDAFAAADDPDLRVGFEVEDDLAGTLVLDEHGFVTVATRME